MITLLFGIITSLVTLFFTFSLYLFATLNEKNLYIAVFYIVFLNIFVITLKGYKFSRYRVLEYADLIYWKRTTLKDLYKVGHIWPLIISKTVFYLVCIASFYLYFSRKTGNFDINELILFFELGIKLVIEKMN